MNTVPVDNKMLSSSALDRVEPHHHSVISGAGESRRVESGEVELSLKRTWGLVFENLPLWLLVLTRSNTSTVILKNWSSLSHFETFLKE